jgi:Mrp family chromosome partitioning ATPase
VSSAGAEAFKAAIRRSLLLIIVLVLLGIVAVNLLRRLEGPRYDANSRVLISAQPLAHTIAGALSGAVPPFVDPVRVMADARALAGSSIVYVRAARESGGDPHDLDAATRVSGGADDDLLTFTASSEEATRAIRIANAVAKAYIAYRADLNARDIRTLSDRLRSKLAGLKSDDPARRDVQAQVNRLDAIASASDSDATLVQSASSAHKTSPAPVKDSLLGLSIGLVVALLVAAVREAVDTTVRSEEDVEDLLSVPVIATVPRLPRRTRLVTYGRHEHAFADTFGLLAANLADSRGESEHRVVAVTSAVSSEGKTTTAANLAVSLARRRMRVILCDFDFRKGALADLFRVPESAPGALQVLGGSASLEPALWFVTLRGEHPRISPNGSAPATGMDDEAQDTEPGASLHLLPSGGTDKRFAIHGPAVATLLLDLRLHADIVILDTPPALLTVEMTELSPLIDDVLVVVRQGRVTRRSLRSLGRQARSWSADLSGAILTDVPRHTQYAYRGR